jgi:multisubunit Na+/H+ antiporter MnhG subunit
MPKPKKPIPKDDDPAFQEGVARMKKLIAAFLAVQAPIIAHQIARAYEERKR